MVIPSGICVHPIGSTSCSMVPSHEQRKPGTTLQGGVAPDVTGTTLSTNELEANRISTLLFITVFMTIFVPPARAQKSEKPKAREFRIKSIVEATLATI
ncbi:hypothetical protein DPMN_043042 [Dreissena polymorpha]|uniref:Uncharacterized protein n=1 Tax=Dreissena polymorpha TaxID=45954 RepID=A0A9D4D360_DREPO|nr:hypothetical protein DPMN_043042 [Dreissena polymorpha]